MSPFIITALTADGYIGKSSDHAALWTSKEDKKRFVELTKKARVIVMGQNTWFTLGKPLKDRLNIVYSPTPLPNTENMSGVETTTKSPQDLIQELESRGFDKVAICGGSQIYTMFMKSGLIKKLYITIEPILFGDGIKLFKEELNVKLELVDTQKTNSGTLLLEYKVL